MSHRPRKRFGQNFLQNPGYIEAIVDAINPKPEQHLVEIGPGLGAITTGLLKAAKSLDVIELDRDLIGPLTKNCANYGDLRIHQADALQFDFNSLAPTPTLISHDHVKLRVVGNIPYNISTPLIFHVLSQMHCICDIHFLLQKELAERLTANPGTKAYGRLSIMVQVHCMVQHLFDIEPHAFSPIPKVESSLVRLLPYSQPPYSIVNYPIFANLVTQAFSQRRKILRNALGNLMAPEHIRNAGIDGTRRPEQLTISEFVQLSSYLAANKDFIATSDVSMEHNFRNRQ